MHRVMCPAPAPAAHPALKAILWGGLLAGLGDYLFAHFYFARQQGDFLAWKLGVFQAVAGGIIGIKAARAGGIPTYVLGVGLHFLIATIWAAIFWGLSRKLPALLKYFIPAGLVFGLVVYYGMNCVVMPLSALQSAVKLPPLVSPPWPAAAHLFLVGLPIAWAAWKFAPPKIND